MEEKRVYELIDIERDIKPYHVIGIYSGVGSGKNSFIEGYHKQGENHLGLAEISRVLFVTSRRAKVDETINRDINMNKGRRLFLKYLGDAEELATKYSDKSIVCTNAHIINKIKNSFKIGDESTYFWKNFDYVVIDEFHSLVTDANYAKDIALIYFWLKFILSLKEKPKVIFMSGTPEPAQELLKEIDDINLDINICDIREKAIYKKPKNFFLLGKEGVFSKIISSYNKGETVIYFTNKTEEVTNALEDLKEYCERQKLDFNKICEATAVFVSKEKTNNKIKKDYPSVYNNSESFKQYLAETEEIPSNVKILITNSKAKEGININSVVEKIIIESHNLYDIIQMCGRVRRTESLKETYLVFDAKAFDSSEGYKRAEEYEFDYEVNSANSFLGKVLKEDGFDEVRLLTNYIENKTGYIKYNPFIEKFDKNFCYALAVNNIITGNHRYNSFTEAKQNNKPSTDKEFNKYFHSNGASLLRYIPHKENLDAAILLEKYLLHEKGIESLDGKVLNRNEKEELHKELNDLLQKYYDCTCGQFARLMGKFGYSVKQSHKGKDKTRWTLTKISGAKIKEEK